MLRIFLSGLLIIGATESFAKGLSPATGPCVYDTQMYCGAVSNPMGYKKKPMPCLMSKMQDLTAECQATIQKAMEEKKS